MIQLYPAFFVGLKKKEVNNFFLRIIALMLLLLAFTFGAKAQDITETYTSNGTFVVPAGVTEITVEAWGAGGGGGNRTSRGEAGGGGGGAYAKSDLTVEPEVSYDIVVGEGGNSGTNGGNSSFAVNMVVADGGKSVPVNNENGGAGGSVANSIGDVVYSGGNGGKAGDTGGWRPTYYSGGGGGAAGSTGNGNSASGQTGGAEKEEHGGAGADGVTNNSDGGDGLQYGGGGSGAKRGWFGNNDGGLGASGFIRITYTPPYRSEFSSANIGDPVWGIGETRTVSVTVKNTGQATWTDSNPDINIGVKWNEEPDYMVRVDANDLAPGAERTYNLEITAPATMGANNLTFDVVNEGNFWFGDTDHSTAIVSEEISIVPDVNKYYSYRSGDWNEPTIWTHDPSGTTQVGNSVPESYDEVYILSGRKVSLSNDIDVDNLRVAINEGGVLDLSGNQFASGLFSLKGQGTLKIASAYFPSVSDINTFVEVNGGTTEYYNASNFQLPQSQSVYNNLLINTSGARATQRNNIILNGDLHVKSGIYRINNNSATNRLSLEINGDVIVEENGFISVGEGNTVTNDTNGGTAPFIDYYNNNSHIVVVKGDFTNNGTVRFTNQDAPDFNSFPNNGIATVYFKGASDNVLYANGQTDFYNLVLDKGSDQTYKLTVQSTAYSNFRLFGRNDLGGEGGGANPNLRKALWLRTGTMVLDGLAVIPTLTEASTGGSPNGDFYIPANAALELKGPEVIVLTTADSYQEINAAYGTSLGSDDEAGVRASGGTQSFSVYGKLSINDGYFSTRESGGIITWDVASGQLEIGGGYLDAKQIRAAGGNNGLASYQQTGGVVALRGRFQRQPNQYNSPVDLRAEGLATIDTDRETGGLDGSMGTFNINDASNVFMMAGGKVQIFDACGNNGYAVDIFAGANNINVTGGAFEILPMDGNNDLIVRTNAPLGNFVVNRSGGGSDVVLGNNFPLTVLKNLSLTNGEFDANDMDVTVGGDFTVAADGSYNSGSNTTLFNGKDDQTFTIDGIVDNGSGGLNVFSINKSSGIIDLDGAVTSLNVAGDMRLQNGIFDDGGKVVYVQGNLACGGIHAGEGHIELNGANVQTIEGGGVLGNLHLNNNNGSLAPIVLNSDIRVNGTITFLRDKLFNIGSNNLELGPDATFVNSGDNRFVQITGQSGDKGITKNCAAPGEFVFPVGVDYYTPATITLNGVPASYGSISVVPVDAEHPNSTEEDRSLAYHWRVKSNGLNLGGATVTHEYLYHDSYVASQGSVNEDEYVPARYLSDSFSWSTGDAIDVDEDNNIIGGSFLTNVDFIEGDYTAGDNTPTNPFGESEIFYSRQNGKWNNNHTWSLSGHAKDDRPSQAPGAGDIVVIGNGHEVTLESNATSPDRDVQNCASLQIEEGSVLDVGYNPGSTFSIVRSHPNGNGLLRVRPSENSGSTFEFPNGDFSEFNTEMGTTELYTTNPEAGTTYWLANDVTSYGNLIISPVGGSNIIFGNTDLTIYGDLTTKGQNSESWFLPTWDSNYPTAPTQRRAKTITIKGDFNIVGGALIYYGNRDLAQDIVVEGNLVVSYGAGIQVYSRANNQSISIGGSLINNASFGNGVDEYAGCDFTDIPVTFFGDNDAKITNTSGTPDTRFDEVTINKGNSQETKLTIDITGNLETPDDNWLTLQNGTLEFKRDNTNQDFTITTQSSFTIPSTAGLLVDYDNSNGARVLMGNDNTNNNDLFLNGKLTIVNGDVFVGAPYSPDNNNDIEYAGGGASAIEVQGGQLVVNGQVRRNPATTSGILSYSQSGGEVVINGRNANATNAKLEVLNQGSEFNMSGGTLTIVRGGGGNSYGDLYLRPESSNVTDGDIVFDNEESGNDEQYQLDANVPLNNLTITGHSGYNATVKLLVSPLTLNGNLNIDNENSIFDANNENNINLTVNGDFINNGTYNHYENLTTFNGGEQTIEGSTATDFYDLKINPVTSVSLIRDVTVRDNLELASGQLLVDDFTVTVNGDLINNATYINGAVSGGVVLSGGEEEHQISGTGAYGRLELNDGHGARLLNDVTLKNDFVLTNGVLNINQYLFTLNSDAYILGDDFGSGKMISSDGVFSNQGMKKYFSANSAGTEFTYPMGIGDKYTPVQVKFTGNNQAGAIRVNAINAKHPSSKDPYRVLDCYWEVEHSGLDGFQGDVDFYYSDDDVLQVVSDEANYIAARLNPVDYNWFKYSADEVVEDENIIHINIGSATNISGEYMAGVDDDIPNDVPVYRSISNGSWSNPAIWQPVGDAPACSDEGPQGAVVIIDSEVTIDENYRFSYKTTINDKLKVDQITYGHNLGKIDGEGTLYVEDALMPAGKYDDFLGCGNNSTLEFGGNGDYNIVADLFTSISNLKVSGSGSRFLPAKTLSICNSLVIDGATLDNSVNNETLIIEGTMERYNSGRFIAGSGANATVSFAGDAEQMLGGTNGGFSGVNAFNNLEIDNASGLSIQGATEVTGTLMLTDGIINTSETKSLTITNTSYNSVTPAGGHSGSFVNGPLVKRILQGGSFTFPVGKDGVLGNKLTVAATQGGTIDWSVEYFTPNSTYAQYSDPVTYVNSKEYWRVSAPDGSKSRIGINWDGSSDVTPLMTMNGLIDLLVANYDDNVGEWIDIESSASGDNNYGTVVTDDRITISAEGQKDFTTATQNAVKAKAKLTPAGVLCGTEAGIPVTFTSSTPIPFNYELVYTIDGVEQTPVTVTSVPFTLPTPQAGEYQLTGFTYNNGTGTGVVDEEIVTVYASPTTADAGANQSNCGGSSVELEGNTADVGVGLWTIVSGDGGSFDAPTSPTSNFSGTNGSAYTLRWSISNGECISADEVTITFPVLADQPGEFSEYDTEVCQGANNVVFTVPLDVTISNYNWSYSGEDVTINGTGNSVSLSFGISATSGTLSVTAENNCGESDPREIAITVNEAISGVTLESNIEGSLCVNNSPVFTAIPAKTITGLSYEFFVNGVSGQNGASETFEPVNLMDADVVNVVATSADGCSTTSNDITVSVVATDGLWMGTEDADWNNVANWCANVVPSTGDITISGNSVHAPEVTADMDLTWLTIEENANLVVKPGVMLEVTGDVVNDGKITLESDADALAALYLPESPTKAGIGNVVMNMPKNYYWYIGSPLRSEVDGKAKASWFGDLNNDPNSIDWVFVLRYKNGRNQWLRVVGDIDLTEMEGVSTWYYQNKVLDYEGEINVGEFSRTFAEIDHHLFANPYPTAIDWEDPAGWGRSDFGNTMWNRVTFGGERTWQTYNNGGDDDPGVYALPPEAFGQTAENVSYIPPYQTVWIKAEKENSTLTVSPETRVKDNSVGLKSAGTDESQKVNIIRLQISNSKALDGTVIYFSGNFMDEKGREDSEKRFNDSKNIPEIYTRIGGNAYSINGKSLLTEAAYSLPVSVRTRIIEETQISVNLSRFQANYDVFLEDKETGAWVNMKENPEYVFVPVHQGHEHNRFVLHLEKTQEIPTNLNNSNEYVPGDISIIGRTEYALVRISSDLLQPSGALIEVLDVNGRLISRMRTIGSSTEVDLPDNSGVYVVRVNAGGTMKTGKVVR